MTLNEDELDMPLLDQDGNKIHDQLAEHSNGGKQVTLTLRRVFSNVLFVEVPEPDGRPKPLEGQEKFRRANLGYKIFNKEPYELPAEDVALLKTLTARLYGGLIVRAAYIYLDKLSTIKG